MLCRWTQRIKTSSGKEAKCLEWVWGARHQTELCMNPNLFIFFMFTRPVSPLQGCSVSSDDIFRPASAVVCSRYISVGWSALHLLVFVCFFRLRIQTVCFYAFPLRKKKTMTSFWIRCAALELFYEKIRLLYVSLINSVRHFIALFACKEINESVDTPILNLSESFTICLVDFSLCVCVCRRECVCKSNEYII